MASENFQQHKSYASRSFSSQGEAVAFDRVGEGQAIVFLHAGIADRRMWDRQFELLSEHYLCIRPDLPGYGQSAIPNQAFSYVTTMLDLLAANEIESAWIVGNSFGGQIALDFTLTHPSRVAGLIPAAPVASGFSPSDRLKAYTHEEDELYEAGKLEAATDLNMRMWVEGPDRTPDQVDADVRQMLWEMQLEAFKIPDPENASVIKIDPPAIGRMAEIRVPTLIVTGNYDLVEILEHADELAEGIPAGARKSIVGTGHILSMEDPEGFNQLVLEFVGTRSQPWMVPQWRAKTDEWALHALKKIGALPDGEPETIHERPWSLAKRITTDQGKYYFKATAPFLAPEAALTEWLSERWPERIVQLVAVNPVQGWLLMSDGGERLRASLKSPGDLGILETILSEYAQTQLDLADQTSAILELGIDDRRLGRLPGLYADLLKRLDIYSPTYLTSEDLEAAIRSKATVDRLVQDLTEIGLPDTLDHGDLHDGNIFYNNGKYYFFDWGDASVTHPFVSLRTTFVSIENTLGLDEGAPEFDRLRDAYLEPWSSHGDSHDLQEAFHLALGLAPLNRALTWHAILSRVNEDQRAPFIDAVPNLIRELLANLRE